MEKNIFAKLIATALNLQERAVANTLALLEEGCTIPFISRYRKERTGGLDEVQIAAISDRFDKLQEILRRKETVIKTITEQDKMTPELQKRIDDCWDSTELEDIYLPYKPKRRTRAQVAREQGLEPLAQILMVQRERDPERAAERFVKGEVKDAETAIKGAQDIIAETVSEDERSRQQLRNAFSRQAFITSKVVKAKADSDEANKYSDYFDWQEPLKRCSSHRLLAMRRGEDEGILRISISPDDEEAVDRLKRHYVYGNTPCGRLVAEAIDDGYKRLLKPAIETEFAASSKEKADEEAIRVFAENLRQLLLGAPLGQKRVMGVDPGFRTGCKVVCLDAQGNLLHHEAIFPHPPVNKRMEAAMAIQKMISKFQIEAISIGNGTASRETASFIKDVIAGRYDIDAKKTSQTPAPQVFVVSEAGASVYSASKIAREEFPEEDVTVRGAVSIGRRLMDPLAELVKIDPKSIGVGQYQHDVDQTKLKHSLDQTVESCVNNVGVNLNTASQHLLMYVSGLGPTLAKNIVDYRRENGAFTSRAQLKKVPRLGPSAYQQCAGFLRIPGAKNPLDNSAVHPESYPIVEQMAKDQGCSVADLIKNKEKREAIDIKRYVTAEVGIPTLTDIMKELEKPGRDPREQLEEFEFDKNVSTIDDLVEGMILPGIVTNITNFGAFVDIGVHQDGLVHISQMANRRIAHPLDVVKLHQHVKVRVVEVDHRRHRISLSLKGLILALLFCLTTISGWAQGDNVGMGGRDEGVASILEKLNVMQKKNEAFNIFLNTNIAYEEYLGHDAQGGFEGRQMRFEARGFLDEHWSYRLRYALNKTWQQQSDGFANSLDIMMVNYQINDRLKISGGKKALSMGGFEYDANAIQVLEYSDFNNYLSTSLIGVEVGYDIGHRQLIQLDVSNTNNNSLDKTYPGAGLEKSRHPLSITVNWIGSRLWDKLENHWSYSYMQEAKGVSNRLLMLGSRLTIGKWTCYLDYYRAWEDIDRHGIVSADAKSPVALRNVRYYSFVGRCLYQITPHWACMVKGFAEQASAPDIPALKNYRHNYGYQAAVQWIPDLSQDARLSLAYVGKTTTFKEACGLPDQTSNRVELSLIYRIKIF